MFGFTRYAVYLIPTAPWAGRATSWLGWDAEAGRAVRQPDLPGLPVPLEQITARPRRYGLHATLHHPFHLEDGVEATRLFRALDRIGTTHHQIPLAGLEPVWMGRFLALCTMEDETPVSRLSAAILRAFDQFRAPPSEAELNRRRGKGLPPRKEANLLQWGYPHVMEDFRVHITLTGPVQPEHRDAVLAAAIDFLGPEISDPFPVTDLGLFGEDASGHFHLLHRVKLLP